jgi:hypothetical protein
VVTRVGTVSLANVPTWAVSFQVVHSMTGALIRDFTGPNAFSFPQVFAQFAAQQQDDLVSRWCIDLIRTKAPDLFG